MRKFLVPIVITLSLQVFGVYADCKKLTKKSDPELLFTCLEDLSGRIDKIEKSNKDVTENTNCPKGMINAGAYCIDHELRFPKGINWLDSNESCIKEGLRLCSAAEISGAARLGLIKTYKISEGNYWVWSDGVVLTKPEGGGVFDACHVELNTDENAYTLGEWNCQTKADHNSSAIGGICCK